jgi:UDP-N-acetylglucosamine 3-dehydrogenase
MKRVRVGIIGAGAISRRAYLPGLSPPDSPQALLAKPPYDWNGCHGVEIVAIADINGDLVRRRVKEFDVAEGYTDWKKIAEHPELDAICIATPNFLHAEMAIGCLENKKHVLVEKPIATSVEEVNAMIMTAKRAGRILMTNFNWRFLPTSEAAKDMVAAGAIGRIHLIRSHAGIGGVEYWRPSSPWRLQESQAQHGAMLDMAIHHVDLMRWIAGKEVQRVSAVTKTVRHDTTVDDLGVALLEFTDDSIGVLEGSWATNPWEISMFFYGSGGNLKMAGDMDPPLRVDLADPPNMSWNDDLPPGSVTHGRFVPKLHAGSRHGSPVAHFVSCVRDGSQPFVTPDDARKSLEILMAIYRSAAEREVIDLPAQERQQDDQGRGSG